MKAVIVESPGNVKVAHVPEPVMGDYDALCQVLAASICSGTDNHIVANHPYHNPKYPLILGHEAIGRVLRCGPKVRYLHPGDLVTRITNHLPAGSPYHLMWGAFAERGIAVDWQAMRDDGLVRSQWSAHTINQVLPTDFDPIASTMIITWRETYAFFKRMNLGTGNLILIIGSGANALAFADHARNLGLSSAVIGSDQREGSFRSTGAAAFVSYQNRDCLSALKKRGVEAVSAIIDAIGAAASLNQVLPLLADKGKIGVYGLDSFLDYKIAAARARGDFSYYSGEHYDEGSAHDDIVAYIQAGKLNAWHYLSREHIYPLEKIEDALSASRTRQTLKSVIRFGV